MQKRFLIAVTFIFSLILISCSGTTKQYLSPEVEGNQGHETVSLLVIDRNDFPNLNTEHKFGELRMNERTIFQERLKTLLRHATGANVKDEMRILDIDQSSFDVRQFTEGGTNMSFVAPQDGTELKTENSTSRFVVILDGFSFDTVEGQIGGSYAGHEQRAVPRIKFETNYLIWDNEKREAIGWGAVGANREIIADQIDELYAQLILDSLQIMARKSPFSS